MSAHVASAGLARLAQQREAADRRLARAHQALSAAQREYAAAKKAQQRAVLALVEAREQRAGGAA